MLRYLNVVTFAALTLRLGGQTPQAASPTAQVIGVGGFSHIVASVEKSVEFYRDVLGLEMPAPPRPFDSTPWISKMGNTPGAQSRPALLHIPGSALGVELIDDKDIDRRPRIRASRTPAQPTLF